MTFSRHLGSKAQRHATTFVGSPNTVVKQVERCREEVGAGVIDLFFQSSGIDDPQRVMDSPALFGKAVLPRIRAI
jgi:hypothetical protein